MKLSTSDVTGAEMGFIHCDWKGKFESPSIPSVYWGLFSMEDVVLIVHLAIPLMASFLCFHLASCKEFNVIECLSSQTWNNGTLNEIAPEMQRVGTTAGHTRPMQVTFTPICLHKSKIF